ncbi:MAG TPA: permease [Polyangia bacterium]|nr:permease [Polyangia bacterium]
MIAGHFGLAAGVKAREPAVPLWALMLATQWLDVVFVPLFIAKVETIEVVGGGAPGYGNGIIHADYTHSLVGAMVLAAVFALPAGLRWGRRAAGILGAVVFSHWILDLLVHRHDLPILPGAPAGALRLGLGLWRWPLLAAAAELALVLWGGFTYLRAAVAAARAHDPSKLRRARIAGATVIGAGLLTLALGVAGL